LNETAGVHWAWSARGLLHRERARVGVLTPSSAQFDAQMLRRALGARGHDDGQNLTLRVVSADGRLESLPTLADQMATEKFDVLVAVNSPATRALLAARGSTPIVRPNCTRVC
jgi:ABC-type uncharacterized transport system substrate-binding protein